MGGWNLALPVCVLMAFARCSPVCALRSRLRSLGIQKNKYNFFKRMMLTELEEVNHILFSHCGGMGGNGTWLSPFAFSWRLRAAVPFALCGPVCAWCYHKFAAKGRTGGVEGIALQVQT